MKREYEVQYRCTVHAYGCNTIEIPDNIAQEDVLNHLLRKINDRRYDVAMEIDWDTTEQYETVGVYDITTDGYIKIPELSDKPLPLDPALDLPTPTKVSNMTYELTFQPNRNDNQLPASALEPGHVYVDTNSDGDAINVLVLRRTGIKGADDVRIFGFVPSENRFTTFKLNEGRSMDVLGFVDKVTLSVGSLINAIPFSTDTTED